jgi:hypothetical protein
VVLNRTSLWVWEEADLALVGGDVVVERAMPVDTSAGYAGLRARVVRIDTGEPAFGEATLNRHGTVRVTGDGGADAIAVRMRHRGNRIVVSVNDKTVRSFPPSRVKRIQIWGYGGNDSLTIAPDLAWGAYVDAGDGNDSVNGGEGNDYFVGGNGNDSLFGGGGRDQLAGGAGNDYLLGGAGGDNTPATAAATPSAAAAATTCSSAAPPPPTTSAAAPATTRRRTIRLIPMTQWKRC